MLQTTDDLAALLGVETATLVKLADPARTRWRHHTVPKRSGGTRHLFEPPHALQVVQRAIGRKILDRYTPHDAAKAFRRGASVVDHAHQHVGQAFVYSTDLRDFFPQINIRRVRGMFLSLPGLDCSPSVAELLARLLCWRGCLPQGAPTSPAIANLIAYRLDLRLTNYCQRRGWTYGRYADDITISGRGRFTARDQRWVEGCLAAEGFPVNPAKTDLRRQHERQTVCGLLVNDRVRLPRQTRKQKRATAHALTQSTDPETRTAQAHGNLGWLKMVGNEQALVTQFQVAVDKS